MAKISILGVETRGVDMKSNALLLGNKKLHAATNMVFEEGVIKTRPGFRYKSLGCSGQFQGSGEFRPRKGLSASPLSDSKSGLAVVTGGEIWLNCKKIGSPISCTGDVNVFQAENYLLFQNVNSSTFWWDGDKLTESPGMQETDWDEIETPTIENEIIAPEAIRVDCDVETATGSVTVTFTVVNSITKTTLGNALVKLYKNGKYVTKGYTGLNGTLTLKASAGAHTYTVTRNSYISGVGSVNINGVPNISAWDTCVPAISVNVGSTALTVELVAIIVTEEQGGCITAFTTPLISVNGIYQTTVTLVNNSGVDKIINGLTLPGGATSDPLPTSLPPGGSSVFTIQVREHSLLTGRPIVLNTECGDTTWTYPVVVIVPPEEETLYVRLSFWNATGANSGSNSYELIQIKYTPPTSIYRGTSAKGDFTIQSSGGMSYQGIPTTAPFQLAFDEETLITGSGYAPGSNATYKPRYGGLGNDPEGQYSFSTFDNGRPHPDWTAFVSHSPIAIPE